MKPRDYLFFVAMLCAFSAKAGCDMCTVYLGMHPNQVQRFVGLRYRTSHYNSTHLHNHEGTHDHSNSDQLYHRNYQSLEFWGQFMPLPKLQTTLIVPYNMNSLESTTGVIDSYNGMGDMQAIARYQVIRSEEDSSSFQYSVLVGAGLKVPTGTFQDRSNLDYLDNHLQTGTGSWDAIASLGFFMQYGNIGINQDLIYKWNGANSIEFKFGNQVAGTVNFFYRQKLGNLYLIPSIGSLLETAKYDELHASSLTETNGTAIYLLTGMDGYFEQWSINIGLQKMMVNKLNDPFTKNLFRASCSINYSF